jgi:predicted TIM-barrel fold metal-dependent hydrolase
VGASASTLLQEWSALRAVDHHCHPLRRWPFTLTALELRAAFSEALDPQVAVHHVQHSAAYQAALRRIARELGCEPDEATVLARRNATDPQAYARHAFRTTATGMMLVDTGFRSADSFTLEEQATALDIPQREVVRLERLAETLIDRSDNLEDWLSSVRGALTEAVNRGAVGVKTICAYRASLKLRQPDIDELADAFDALKQRAREGEPVRLSGDPLCHALLLDAARECVRLDVPLQVHCGFGDPDEDLAQASPLGLRPLFLDAAYRGLRVALLHCYPYHREAAYLCSVFPDVYMDLSLAIPFAAQDGARAMQETLGLCPTSKLLYASDASRYPEVFFVAASLHREALADAISELIDRDVFGTALAIEAGRQVLAGNARRVYRLGAA